MASEEQSKSSIEPVLAPKGHGAPGHGHPGDAAKHGDKALRLLGDERIVLTDEDVSPPGGPKMRSHGGGGAGGGGSMLTPQLSRTGAFDARRTRPS